MRNRGSWLAAIARSIRLQPQPVVRRCAVGLDAKVAVKDCNARICDDSGISQATVDWQIGKRALPSGEEPDICV